jgi:hypothetical protein
MRKLSGIFLVGLCLGAIGTIVVTATRDAAPAAQPIAVTQDVTTMSESPEPAPAKTPTPGPSTAPSTAPKTDPVSKVDTVGKVDAAALDRLVPGGEVSAVVFDREAGATGAAVFSAHAERAYTSASLVKLLIALAVLDRDGPADQVKRMLSRSDDELASRFWSGYGGPVIVTRWAAKLGLTGTRAPADPGRWGDTRITAADVVKIYRYLLDRASAGTRGTILTALRGATEAGSDGFRQYFGIPDAVGERPWAVKQGWSCCLPTRMLHTSGLVGDGDRYIVAVLTEHPQAVSYATGSKRVTAVVSALFG